MSAKKVSFGPRPRTPATDETPSGAAIESWVQGAAMSPQDAAAVPMKRLTIDLPQDLHRELKVLAARQGVKMADLVREWVRQGVIKESR